MTPENFLAKFSPLQLPLHGVRLPSFTVPEEVKKSLKLPDGVSNFDFLRALCLAGFKKLKLEKANPKYQVYADRVKHELDVIKELDFVDYILLVWTVINYCHTNDIPVGLGRGSAAGSLVLYLVGVTRIDPIKHELFFERFISKTRAKKNIVDGIVYLDGSLMCDVDMDICYYNRPKVLAYLEEKFRGRTAKILTLNTLSGKLLIKECGKIIGEKSEQEMGEVSDMIPKTHGVVADIEDAYRGIPSKEKEGEWKLAPVEAFVKWCNENPTIYATALKLRDLVKNKGVHASGVLLSHDLIQDTVPVELSSDKVEVSSFDMKWSSAFNVKLDVLGLRSVSVVDDVCKSVGIKLEDIDFEDPFIYQNLQDLKTPHGLFQVEAETNYRFLRHVRPKSLEELSAVLALARPGAMQFIDKYAKFTNTGEYEAIHPFFDDILKPTGGVAIYQEQLMKMAHKIGFTLDEAEILRRIVGKKLLHEVAEWESKIEQKLKENNLDPNIKSILWKILEDSASYSFNKSHSVAYAALAAITVYLKFKYPKEFYVSLLKMTRHEPDPTSEISKISKELHHFNIELLPPHLLKSKLDFAVEDKDIRFGLLSIKGISDKSIERVDQFRNKYSNKFEIFQGAEEAGLQIGITSAIIQAGALEGFTQSRSRVVLEAQIWNLLTDREKILAIPFGETVNYNVIEAIRYLNEVAKDAKGKPMIKDSRRETIKKHCKKYEEIYHQNQASEELANWYYERTLLGYVHSTSLRTIFKHPNLSFTGDVEQVINAPEGNTVLFVGTVSDVHKGVSRSVKKTPYFKMKVSDETASITVLMFDTPREQNVVNCQAENGRLPEDDDIVIVRGTRKGDAVFAKYAIIQKYEIYMKLSQLKSAQKKLTDKEEKEKIKE